MTLSPFPSLPSIVPTALTGGSAFSIEETAMDHKFECGAVVATPKFSPRPSPPTRHQPFTPPVPHATGDWGDVCSDDAAANDDAVRTGTRLLSSYRINATSTVWITEAVSNWDDQGNALIVPKRLASTILLPSEY